jgi:PqqD family protein of HPr-rel-A system
MAYDVSRLKQLAVNESGFVFDPFSGHTFTLNDTGLAVLAALKEGLEPEQIATRLAADFELDGTEDVSRDVDDFLHRLRESGLLR